MSTELTLNDCSEDIFSFSNENSEQALTEIKNEKNILDLLKQKPLPLDNRFGLKAEAYFLQLAYANNKILSLSNSRTKILAHQVESTYVVVNSLNQRFILADEVGLGKTVEAGLIIKELVYRYNYKKILVACPASLLVQWQHEMEEKFGEHFEILDRKYLEKRRKEIGEFKNPWDTFTKVICSLDFIKNETFQSELSKSSWDAVIFDEAHRLRRDAQTTTLVYNIAELLSSRSKSALLLTATPFRGKLEELYYLVRLVDKNLLGPIQSFTNEFCMPDSDLSRLKEKLSTVLLRRTKKEIGGFTVRHARTIRFDLYPDEQELYDETTRYVVEEFNRALQTENRAVGFVMTVFQKLLDSSSFALYSALSNRKRHLSEMLEKAKKRVMITENADQILKSSESDINVQESFDENEDIDEYFNVSLQKTADELNEEIITIDRLLKIASSIKKNKKAEKLKEMMLSLRKKGHKKFLIFTQFKTTQDYLYKLLSDFRVEVFHGSMDKDQKEQAIEDFKADTEVLICTEAGGEGRNMQFCNILFNYDLPWSPLKIEQRIGRLHRFGQKYDVFVYNFSTKGTVAERVLDVLIRKLDLFTESIGTPDLMLGQIEDELTLNSLFMDMTSGRASKKEVYKKIDESIVKAKKSFEKLSELTVARKMDFNYDDYYKITQTDRKFSNKQLESFIDRFCTETSFGKQYLGKLNKKTGLVQVNCKDENYKFQSSGTFDSEKALANSKLEFLAFGHPIIDNCIAHSHNDDFAGHTGVKTIESENKFLGLVFYYLVTYKSISETKELVPVIVDSENNLLNYELDDIERELIQQHNNVDFELVNKYSNKIDNIIENIDNYNLKARARIDKIVEHKIWDIKENLDLQIDPEIEKINESYNKQLAELREKLSLQESQLRLQGKDMKSAITRTKNKIAKTKSEMEQILAKYRKYHGVTYSISLISAGIIIGNNKY